MSAIRITAFQKSGFQLSGFQEASGAGSGDFASAFRMMHDVNRALAEQRKRDERRRKDDTPVLPEVEHVTAQAAPIVTDLAARLAAIAPIAPRTKLTFVLDQPDRELDEFRALMKLVASMDEALEC